MPNAEHVQKLRQGVASWNAWRSETPQVRPDLAGLDWKEANLRRADLSNAILTGAKLHRARLSKVNLAHADLAGADLRAAYFRRADLTDANLRGANLKYAVMVGTNLDGADISDAHVYGVAAWDVIGTPLRQTDLVITRREANAITVDDLEVAQFVYLLLNNAKIRNVVETIGHKGVLILGRFTEERLAVLEAIRGRLRALGFVPVMFDFTRPTQLDFTETVRTLAGLCRFIIADITNPKSSPLELQATMPDYMIPFVPIIQEGETPFAMFQDLQNKYGDWVLDVLEYDSADNLVDVLLDAVVRPAVSKHDELLARKAAAIRTRHVRDYGSRSTP
jgi:hypothetical protein